MCAESVESDDHTVYLHDTNSDECSVSGDDDTPIEDQNRHVKPASTRLSKRRGSGVLPHSDEVQIQSTCSQPAASIKAGMLFALRSSLKSSRIHNSLTKEIVGSDDAGASSILLTSNRYVYCTTHITHYAVICLKVSFICMQ